MFFYIAVTDVLNLNHPLFILLTKKSAHQYCSTCGTYEVFGLSIDKQLKHSDWFFEFIFTLYL